MTDMPKAILQIHLGVPDSASFDAFYAIDDFTLNFESSEECSLMPVNSAPPRKPTE